MIKIITNLFTSDKRFLIGLFLILSFSFSYGQEVNKPRVGSSPDKSLLIKGGQQEGPGTGNSIEVPNDDATYGSTPKQLVENILASSCMSIGNVRFGYYRRNGNNWTWNNQFGSSTLDRQLGYFNEGSAVNFGIEEGLLLSTGKIKNARGPSASGGYSDEMNSNASDPDLALITGRRMYDAAVLEIDFTPVGTKIEFQFIFASDEYLEYCGTEFEDIFGFFLSGPGIAGGQGYQNNAVNLAKLPNGDPITINTIHPYVASNVNGNSVAATNPAYYANNNINVSTEFDGGTVVLTAEYSGLTSGQQYKMKMAIADASDQKWDAGVFLKARSFTSNALVVNDPAPLCLGVTTADITAPAVTAGSTIPGPYTYWQDEAATITYSTPTMAPVGTYYIKAVDSNSGCEIIKPVTVSNSDLDSSYTKQNITCFGDSDGSIDLSVTGGTGSYTYSWTTNDGSGLNPSSQNQSGLTAGTYKVTIDDGNCAIQETIVIEEANPITASATNSGPVCSTTSSISLDETGGDAISWSWSSDGGAVFSNATIKNPTVTNFVDGETFTVIITDGNGCTKSATTTIEVNETPLVDNPSDVTECDSYTLPVLTYGNYFTGSGGTGSALNAGDAITSTQTIYVYAQTGTSPNCTAENSFVVTINETPLVDNPSDVTECDSYTLPVLTYGNYFTG
ncbi:choice-of-anchor L domain-containing protein, partial [Aequorivita sinensis]|uniref:choice-of-anchor L domain-containing protein n=1 Tax=Aequorivita sinensis TaxID=1382458 RepID=UPI002300201D